MKPFCCIRYYDCEFVLVCVCSNGMNYDYILYRLHYSESMDILYYWSFLIDSVCKSVLASDRMRPKWIYAFAITEFPAMPSIQTALPTLVANHILNRYHRMDFEVSWRFLYFRRKFCNWISSIERMSGKFCEIASTYKNINWLNPKSVQT